MLIEEKNEINKMANLMRNEIIYNSYKCKFELAWPKCAKQFLTDKRHVTAGHFQYHACNCGSFLTPHVLFHLYHDENKLIFYEMMMI